MTTTVTSNQGDQPLFTKSDPHILSYMAAKVASIAFRILYYVPFSSYLGDFVAKFSTTAFCLIHESLGNNYFTSSTLDLMQKQLKDTVYDGSNCSPLYVRTWVKLTKETNFMFEEKFWDDFLYEFNFNVAKKLSAVHREFPFKRSPYCFSQENRFSLYRFLNDLSIDELKDYFNSLGPLTAEVIYKMVLMENTFSPDCKKKATTAYADTIGSDELLRDIISTMIYAPEGIKDLIIPYLLQNGALSSYQAAEELIESCNQYDLNDLLSSASKQSYYTEEQKIWLFEAATKKLGCVEFLKTLFKYPFQYDKPLQEKALNLFFQSQELDTYERVESLVNACEVTPLDLLRSHKFSIRLPSQQKKWLARAFSEKLGFQPFLRKLLFYPDPRLEQEVRLQFLNLLTEHEILAIYFKGDNRRISLLQELVKQQMALAPPIDRLKIIDRLKLKIFYEIIVNDPNALSELSTTRYRFNDTFLFQGLTPFMMDLFLNNGDNCALLIFNSTHQNLAIIYPGQENAYLDTLSRNFFWVQKVQNETLSNGETLATLATQLRHHKTLKMIRVYNRANEKGKKPLEILFDSYQYTSEDHELAKYLISHGANIDEILSDQETLLTRAMKENDFAKAVQLLSYHPNLYINKNYQTIIQTSPEQSNKWLTIFTKFFTKEDLLDNAIKTKDYSFIEWMIQKEDFTPLLQRSHKKTNQLFHLALKNKHDGLVELLTTQLNATLDPECPSFRELIDHVVEHLEVETLEKLRHLGLEGLNLYHAFFRKALEEDNLAAFQAVYPLVNLQMLPNQELFEQALNSRALNIAGYLFDRLDLENIQNPAQLLLILIVNHLSPKRIKKLIEIVPAEDLKKLEESLICTVIKAGASHHILKLLIQKGLSVDFTTTNKGTKDTPLTLAMCKYLNDHVQVLLENNAKLTPQIKILKVRGKGLIRVTFTPLMISLIHEEYDLAYQILQSPQFRLQDLLHQNSKKESAFLIACEDSDITPDMIRHLLDAERRLSTEKTTPLTLVQQQDAEGNTPLHLVTANCNFDSLRALLENGAEVNIQNQSGETPIFIASEIGMSNPLRVLFLQRLIKYGADVNIPDHYGSLLINTLIRKDLPLDILRVILRAGANVELRENKELTINYSNVQCEVTPLEYAAHLGKVDVCDCLIDEFDASVGNILNESQNALTLVIRDKKFYMAQHLIRKGLAINGFREDHSPFEHALRFYHDYVGREQARNIMRILIEEGAQVHFSVNHRDRFQAFELAQDFDPNSIFMRQTHLNAAHNRVPRVLNSLTNLGGAEAIVAEYLPNPQITIEDPI